MEEQLMYHKCLQFFFILLKKNGCNQMISNTDWYTYIFSLFIDYSTYFIEQFIV